MKTYIFKVIVEPDENAWSAYCPVLLKHGASTYGNSQEEALRNINQVIQMVIESLIDHGEPIPEGPPDSVQISNEVQVAVTV